MPPRPQNRTERGWGRKALRRSCPFDSPCGGPLLALGCVQLDVTAAQRAPRAVAVAGTGYPNRKGVVGSGLAIVGHVHLIGEPALPVHLGRALNVPRRGADDRLGGDTGASPGRAARAWS